MKLERKCWNCNHEFTTGDALYDIDCISTSQFDGNDDNNVSMSMACPKCFIEIESATVPIVNFKPLEIDMKDKQHLEALRTCAEQTKYLYDNNQRAMILEDEPNNEG